MREISRLDLSARDTVRLVWSVELWKLFNCLAIGDILFCCYRNLHKNTVRLFQIYGVPIGFAVFLYNSRALKFHGCKTIDWH